MNNNSYARYYLDQQQGRGMAVFRGSPWQAGHGQHGYALGGLFRSIARVAMPAVKSGAKALGKIALNSDLNLLGDVMSGKNVKEAARTSALEAANTAKSKAVQRVQTFAQTGKGSKRIRRRQLKKTTRRQAKRQAAKRWKTSPKDIFG